MRFFLFFGAFVLGMILLTFFVLSQKSTSIEDLAGHWHLKRTGKQDDYEMAVFDIGFDSSVVTLYRNDTFGIGGLSKQLDTAYLKMGHSWKLFVLTGVKGDRIEGKWLHDTTQNVYLERFEADADHQRNDFFNDGRLEVNLPQDTFSRFENKIFRKVLHAEITLGFRSSEITDEQQIATLKLGDKIVDLLHPSDLTLFFEQHRVKLPEKMRPLIKPVFYFDKKTPPELIMDFQLFCAAMGYDTSFLVHEVVAGQDRFELSYQQLFAPKLPAGVSLVTDPAQLLCLGLATEPRTFTSGLLDPTLKRKLPDSLQYGFYYFAPGSTENFSLEVAFSGPASQWRAEDKGQYFVSTTFNTAAYRLWNGLQVGQPMARYAHLGFTKTEAAYVREEQRLSYVVETSNAGLITSILVFANYYRSGETLSASGEQWALHLWQHSDCRLRTQ